MRHQITLKLCHIKTCLFMAGRHTKDTGESLSLRLPGWFQQCNSLGGRTKFPLYNAIWWLFIDSTIGPLTMINCWVEQYNYLQLRLKTVTWTSWVILGPTWTVQLHAHHIQTHQRTLSHHICSSRSVHMVAVFENTLFMWTRQFAGWHTPPRFCIALFINMR